jgi:ubiquinone/menaquinone biosynthesis C-methylase UbiE
MEINSPNSEYWNELCGTRAASKLGIVPGRVSDAVIFDEWFFDYYPYLNNNTFIEWSSLSGLNVLEVGLGYGSVGRKLIANSGEYIGVDISPGPVEFLRASASPLGNFKTLSASVLNLPFGDDEFDFVVSIGCIHHTGDLDAALGEIQRVLKPNGKFVLMAYYAYSYKRWITHPIATFRRLIAEARNHKNFQTPNVGGWWYDRHLDGTAPPHTEFISKRQMMQKLSWAKDLDFWICNIDNLQDLMPVSKQKVSRDQLRIRLIKLGFGRRLGLDLYITGVKS